MKNSILALLLLAASNLFAVPHMPRVNANLFIHQAKTDFDAIELTDETLKMQLVKELFNNDLIDHSGSKAYDSNADFDKYYADYKRSYYLIDMNADGNPELIFSGLIGLDNDMERFQIFAAVNKQLKSIYMEIGHLLAYKVQPNTKEILLYHHQYPCCYSASHNLNRLRLINNKIQTIRYYFLGRDSDMKGTFFPKKSMFKNNYKQSALGFHLYWSPEKIDKNAWYGRSETNEIATFDSGSVYTILAMKDKWKFVLVKSAPKLDKKNKVINPENFKATFIFGWISKDEN